LETFAINVILIAIHAKYIHNNVLVAVVG